MRKTKRAAVFILLLIFLTGLAAYFTCLLHLVLQGDFFNDTVIDYSLKAMLDFFIAEPKVQKLFVPIEVIAIAWLAFCVWFSGGNNKNDMQQVTPEIIIPRPCGEKQHGSANWLKPADYKKAFAKVKISILSPAIRSLIKYGYYDLSFYKRHKNTLDIVISKPIIKGGGYVVGGQSSLLSNSFYYIKDDIHSVTVGGTRVGKTRYVVIEGICLMALAGESMINIDVKGELFLSTCAFLKRLGYNVYALDFVEPEKSDCYNFLQPVIDYLNDNEISKAQDATWDIVSSLVGESKGEKLWNNGECSVIAFSIFCVTWENRDKPQFQNMNNVYYFIAEMCRAVEKGVLPIIEYADSLPDSHPAKSLIRISEVAPQRTRGSFFTSALATLRLFTNGSISTMTSKSSINTNKTGDEKTAVFIILPDEKTTYNGIATLFINQQYQQLVKRARQNGNRLNLRVNFNEDEFGNFPAIPDYDTAITAGGGRGIRFNMFLQSFSQLNDKYGREKTDTIVHNCEIWNLMQSTSDSTIKQFQARMGSYTIKSQSGSSSANMSGYQSSSSSSYNLMGRKLLEEDEFGKINRPYQLVLSKKDPAMMTAMPLEKTLFNKMLGLGNKAHNQKVFMDRNSRRPTLNISKQGDNLWGIWNEYRQGEERKKAKVMGATSLFYIKNDKETEDFYGTCVATEEYDQGVDDD
ncbi:MAG: type IV secretory system conjugative DNA transfer family protein [Hydrogenoanaerobacterium sp.]